MATINNTLKLNDKMSSTFSSITKAMHSTLNVMKDVNSGNSSLSNSFKKAKDDIMQAEKELQNLQGELRNANQESRNTGNAFNVFIGNMLTKAFDKAIAGAQKLVGLSDQYVSSTARLNMMNDGLQTTAELQDLIYESAQRARGSYLAMTETVAKLGNQAGEAFNNNSKEIIAFSELLNKTFTASGMDATGIESTMYNMTQSLASGKLLGQDYRILKQNAPQMIKYLQDYFNTNAAGLDEMVSKGQVTAQSLKNAMFAATDDINKKFNQMPITWGQLWNKITNRVQKALKPLLMVISNIISFIDSNWSTIEMVLTALAITIGIVTTAWLIHKSAVVVTDIALKILNGTLSTTAILTTLLVLVLFGIVLALIYLWNTNDDVAYGMLFAWDMLTTAGMVMKALLEAAFYGIIIAGLYMYQGFLGVKMGMQTAFYMLILGAQSMQLGFQGAMEGIVNAGIWMYNKIVELLNKLGANMSTISYADFTSGTINAMSKTMGDYAKAIGETYGDMEGVNSAISEYQNKLSDLSTNTDIAVNNKIATDNATRNERVANRKKVGGGFGSLGGANLGALSDVSDMLEDVMGSDGAGGKALKTTSDDKLLTDEDIQLLLDVATRDYKLNYQSITPDITVTFGDVRETADVDLITDRIADKLQEIYDANLEVN